MKVALNPVRAMAVNGILLILCALLVFLVYLLVRSTNFIGFVLLLLGWSRLRDPDETTDSTEGFCGFGDRGRCGYKYSSYQNDNCNSSASLNTYQLSPKWSSPVLASPGSTTTGEEANLDRTAVGTAQVRPSCQLDSLQVCDMNATSTCADLDLRLPMSTTPRPSICSEDEDRTDPGLLRRAISTESVGSSSSALGNYGEDDPSVQITVSYDRNEQMFRTQLSRLFDPPQGASLHLIFYLLPHPKPLWRTEARSISSNPVEFDQSFRQCVRSKDVNKIALLVQLYVERECVRLAGQCRVRLRDVILHPPTTLYLTLKEEKQGIDEAECSLGEILFSLFYQNDRLSIVVMKLRGIEPSVTETMVRIYVVQSGGRVLKKRTSTQVVHEGGTVFNESVFITVLKSKIERSNIRLSVVGMSSSDTRSIGHVTIGPKTSGKEYGHFQRMLASQDRPVSMWHNIKPKNKMI